MKEYRIVYGAFVRMYADHTIEAENDEAARKLAIEEFKAKGADLQWHDAQYDDLALPSIVSLETTDPLGEVLVCHDFSVTPADARQFAADAMLQALEFVRMTFCRYRGVETQGLFHRMPGDRRQSHRRGDGRLKGSAIDHS